MRSFVCVLLLAGAGCSGRSEPNPELKVPEIPAGRAPAGQGGASKSVKPTK